MRRTRDPRPVYPPEWESSTLYDAAVPGIGDCVCSPADWISPNPDGGYRDNPPAGDGKHVILTDTDHLWGIGGSQSWVWKSFLRGLNPLFMDPYDGTVLGTRFDPQWEPIRKSMGLAARIAEQTDLGALQPDIDLASTGYCLASRGAEYLAYAPEGGEFSIDLSAAQRRAKVRWLDPSRGTFRTAADVEGGQRQVFRSNGQGDAVVHVKF